MDRKWTQIILDAEDMWLKSAIYRHFPLSASEEEFEIERDMFKIRCIYDLYGYEYAKRFAQEHPNTITYLNQYTPCSVYSNYGQCSMFCHKYNVEKGCTLNATE